jgi:hypothetical protein
MAILEWQQQFYIENKCQQFANLSTRCSSIQMKEKNFLLHSGTRVLCAIVEMGSKKVTNARTRKKNVIYIQFMVSLVLVRPSVMLSLPISAAGECG